MRRYFKIFKEYVSAFVPYIITNLYSFILPIKREKFFCMSMAGRNYGDNIKCLSDYIKSVNTNAEIVWAFDENYYNIVDCEEKKVKLYSFVYYYHLMTSKYFLTNQQCRNIMFRKRRGQIKLQTWHGTALKRLGRDVEGREISRYASLFTPNKNKYELRDTDIFLAGSKFMVNVFRSAYGWEKQYLTGTPRNDIFFKDDDQIKKKVRDYYKLQDEKIILYAPTFRINLKLTYYDIDLKEIKRYFEERDKAEYVVLIKLHPNIMSMVSHLSEIQDVEFIDATLYPNMQELLYVSDVLITDYSSVSFDFMYSYKPVILYVPDRNEYNRGFYLDIDKLPFVVVNNNNDIHNALVQFDWNLYHQRIDEFLERIGSVEDGRATERVYRMLINYPHIDEEVYC